MVADGCWERIMKYKDFFLFPSFSKVIFTLILFFSVGCIIWPAVLGWVLFDFYPIGFPLPLYATGLCPPDYICVKFTWMSLLVDLFFWYFVASTVIYLGMKRKKWKKSNVSP